MPEIDVNKKRNTDDAQIDLETFWNENQTLKNPHNRLLPFDWSEHTSGVSSKTPDVERDIFIPIGKNHNGYVTFDLSLGQSLLAGGSMLSGAGVFRRATVASLLKYHSPDDLRIILIDPKGLMADYDNIPYLQFPRARTLKEALKALEWCQKETDRRLQILEKSDTTSVWSYNSHKPETEAAIPSIVVFITELGDLSDTHSFDTILYKIAGLTRATHIHFIVTTQQPSPDVITPIIQDTFGNRIAFQMPFEIESRLFIGKAGAENLLGQGDMLFKVGRTDEVIRLQGLYAR